MEYKNETKNCQNCKNDFTIESEDFSFYEKMKVPPPTWCPECRMIRRFCFRNESMLFRRKDAHTEKDIFSGFNSDAPVLTYENSYWFSDDWDRMASGVEYDFSVNFFDQFRNLLSRAPLPARSVFNMVNSDYCNEASETKNSYLCFNTDYVENSAYMRKITHIKDSFDLYECTENELCYENVFVDKSYRTFYSFDCESCVDVWFSKGLRGCTDCFGCVNLIQKSYCIFNEQYSKEEYFRKISEYNLSSYIEIQNLKQKTKEFWFTFPVKFNHALRNINSSGERVFDSKNVKFCYSVHGSEDLRYCQDIQPKATNCYDYSIWGVGSQEIYECIVCGIGCYNLKFCFNCWDSAQDLEYCVYCLSSKNCFGCVGLYKGEYCIFNKQYTKEEYFKLVEQIKKQMDDVPYVDDKGRVYRYGEFFPYDISLLAYNESMAQDFFPLNKESSTNLGVLWREPNVREFETTIDSIDLSDNSAEATEQVLKEIIKCSECKKAFRIIEKEFQFYKRVGLPLPRFCHNCRFAERFKLVNPPKLWSRQCMCNKQNHNNHKDNCEVEFETSYAPERPEIVYCEKCYQQEVY
ncbi:MAG: hypothetical protein AAB438_01975 [Patescibacteria group bacterium]